MNGRLICTDCSNPIPNGTAIIRSRSLEQRAWHRECFEFTHPGADVAELRVPVQRSGAHDVADVRVS